MSIFWQELAARISTIIIDIINNFIFFTFYYIVLLNKDNIVNMSNIELKNAGLKITLPRVKILSKLEMLIIIIRPQRISIKN